VLLCRECYMCYSKFHSMPLGKPFRRTILPEFGLYARCPEACTGCRVEKKLSQAESSRLAGAASAAARPSAEVRVRERFAAVPEDKRQIARAEPHCWWCGTTADDCTRRAALLVVWDDGR
jgi:hypothetical protein